MRIPVIWKSYKEEIPNRNYWDQGMLEAIFEGNLWKPIVVITFDHYDQFTELPEAAQGAIVIIPGRYHAEYVREINNDIARLKWCVLIITGDEEAVFPIDKIIHPNIKIYAQTPHEGKYKKIDRFLINGWPAITKKHLDHMPVPSKITHCYFAGQITHSRRQEMAQAIKDIPDSLFYPSKAFTKGLHPRAYIELMRDSIVVPCPSGAVIPDSFRVYEALEAACVPILDAKSPVIETNDYWHMLFGEDELPMPIISDWSDLPGLVEYHKDVYPRTNNRVFAWWQNYKRDMVYNLIDDILYLQQNDIENVMSDSNEITAIIPTSSIPSHPDTSIIEETIKSVRERLPNAEIIILFDGLRDEHADRRHKYEKYIERILWKCNYEWKNVLPIIFKEHTHQVGMTRAALKKVRTPMILFVEHDTPLCGEIPFQNLSDAIIEGHANVIRLHHEALILEPHQYLMLDKSPINQNGVPMLRTAQWSQRPHLANKDFYQEMLDKYFSANAISMIEDGVHGKVQEAYRKRQKVGWNEFKLWIYAPEGDMKRSYHTDGRGTDPKFEDTFKF